MMIEIRKFELLFKLLADHFGALRDLESWKDKVKLLIIVVQFARHQPTN